MKDFVVVSTFQERLLVSAESAEEAIAAYESARPGIYTLGTKRVDVSVEQEAEPAPAEEAPQE